MDGRKGLSAPWRALITFNFALILLVSACAAANAQFYVRSPDVEKGETEVEEHGAVYAGPGGEERLRQSHEVEFKHGFTDRFEVIIEGFFRQEIGEEFEARQFEAGGQYEIIEREGDGFGLSFRTIYEVALQGQPDEILFGPLARVVRGRNSSTINTFFVGQVGEEAEIDSLELQVNWQLKHELGEKFALGLEGFSEIEDLSHPGSFADQEHRLGPVAYFKLGEYDEKAHGPEWKLAAGTLFGISEATSDVTFKFDIEAEF
jgi:hypothetical protein